MSELSIVIPAYNEARRITPMLQDYTQYFCEGDVELIVVLNGCTDATLAIVQAFQRQYPKMVRYLNLNQALGKGGAVKTGLLAATGKYRGFVDADESTAPAEFDRLFQRLLAETVDGVIASRWLPGAIVHRTSRLRQLASRVFIRIIRWRFHMPFMDTQCGAKIFTDMLVQAVVPTLTVRDMAFDVELLYNASKHGYTLIEVPTVWTDKTSSTLFRSPLDFIRHSLTILYTIFSLKR